MSLPVNILSWFLAALPIIALLLLMVRFQWGASKAAPVGLGIALVSAVAFFKAGGVLIGVEILKALWNALTIILIIWTAILIYEVTNEAKAFNVLKQKMKRITPNELLRILGIGMVFASFLQGVTGFGVPVAVTAPLLIGIGVKPLWAVVIPLIGHCWAGTFGTLAVAWQSLLMQTGLLDSLMAKQAGLYAGGFIWIINLASGLAICWFYGRIRALKKGLPAVPIILLIQGGGQLLLTQVDQVLACFIPGCGALIALFIMCRCKRYREDWSVPNSPVMERTAAEKEEAAEGMATMNINEAFLPYYVMTAVTLLVLLIEPVRSFLEGFTLGLSFPETSTGYGVVNPEVPLYSPFRPLTHASIFLFISALCGFLYYMKKGYAKKDAGKRIFMRSLKKTIPSSFAVMFLIMMSRVMSGSGQTIVLASGASNVLNVFYAVMAPFIGLLGSFMTSSNMSSNILFGNFQQATAGFLHLNTLAVLGAQTAGGALGTSISPGNIILGTTMAGILGSEGKVLKKILPFAASLAFIFGIILFVSYII